MSSDIFEPKQIQVGITLAEENLLEQLDGFLSRLLNLMSEIDGMFNDVFQGRLEILRARIAKTLGISRDLRNVYRGILEYASRITPALVSGIHYLNALNTSSEFLESTHRLCMHLSLLQPPLQLNEDVVIFVQKTVNLLMDSINMVRNTLKMYMELPIKVGEYISELLKTAQNLRLYYDESYIKIMRKETNEVFIAVMNDVDDMINSFIRMYEALSCLHAVKRG